MATQRVSSLTAAVLKAAGLARQQVFAAEQAVTDTAFEGRRAVQRAMPLVFDRPTPFVVSGVRVETARRLRELSAATSAAGLGPGRFGGTITAIVDIDPDGRGKGATPEKVLSAEVFGGRRGYKGAERRLQAAGLMPPGHFMVPSTRLLADASKVDGFGNVRASFIRSLLSYLQAFNTAGFSANASQRTLARLARRGRTGDRGPERSGQVGFATINGVVYFVSRGRGGGERGNRLQHLPPGIWAKRGVGGAEVYPVFLFVPGVGYQVRLRFEEILRNVTERAFPQFFAQRLQRALATAR